MWQYQSGGKGVCIDQLCARNVLLFMIGARKGTLKIDQIPADAR